MATHVYDKECIERYGRKTCIIIQKTNLQKYEMRLLEKIKEGKIETYEIEKNSFYYLIPNLLKYRYTVVIVEELPVEGNHKEITAVHLPVQATLNTPPIIQ